MSRLSHIFAEARAARRAALMPFITGGYPSLDATAALIPALEDAGAAALEIGFPFSDPIADGPVIAASMHEALLAGTTPRKLFDLVARVRSRTRLGLIAMVSVSIVDRLGAEAFFRDAAAAGFDGVILPDLDLAAAAPLRLLADQNNLAFTLLAAPTTMADRAASIARLCTGFIYLLARTGVTGERDSIDLPSLRERVKMLRAASDLPIAAGFGISRPEHAAAVAQLVDGVIVGSAVVRRIAAADDPVAAAGQFVRQLSAALRAP